MLVEKYEALLTMQEQQQKQLRHKSSETNASCSQVNRCMSLRDELQMSGNYYDADKRYQTDSEIEDENEPSAEQRKKGENAAQLNVAVAAAAAKSTASSPGVEDIRHKGTQTEVLAALPGSFLCKISDGNDCQFSIYDDASPVESRFRKTPEYRQLFKEIFAVLKRAAEAKDEGESLPLLDDRLPVAAAADAHQQPKVPPVTPAREDLPAIPVGEEIVADVPAEAAKPAEAAGNDSRPDIMKQLMEGVRFGGGAPKRHANRCEQKGLPHYASPSPSPSHSRSTSSKRRAASKARKKRDRLTDSPNRSRERHQQKSNRPVEGDCGPADGQPGRRARPQSMYVFGSANGSSASQEVAKLKILEKSYAEVLRMGRKANANKFASFAES